jgi:uncharacterized protein with NAD-binding domain and iron-sulfur cluster
MKVIVVGADLAGLTCAKVLTGRGAEVVFEAADEFGGWVRLVPENFIDTPGLVLAGEYTEDSSINSSMLSGEKAAKEAMRA